MSRTAPRAHSLVSRRSLIGRAAAAGGALAAGSRLSRALAQEATPSASPVEFLRMSRGDPALPLGNPAKLAIAPDGAVWVADGSNHLFQIFAPDGTFRERWGTPGSGEGEFDFFFPGAGAASAGDGDYGAIAFAPDGSFYITDPGNSRVQKFGPDRRFLTAWGSPGSHVRRNEPGQLLLPVDLVVDGHGLVYVLDYFRHNTPTGRGTGAVQVFDADGTYLAEWGEYVHFDPGGLIDPIGISLDPDGTLLVVEFFMNNRVQRFTPEGEFLDGWGEYGIEDGQFYVAMDVAVDAAGRVFVIDADGRVQVFNREGRFLATWGTRGNDPDTLTDPLGVAISGDGMVYVSDGGKRLLTFRVVDLPGASPATPAAAGTPSG